MVTYSVFLLVFLIFFNAFCIGKIIQKYYTNLSAGMTYFAGFLIYTVCYNISYIPFILIASVDYFYIYVLLTIQILMLIVYCFFYKCFTISFIFNYRVLLSSVIVIFFLFIFYYLFYTLGNEINQTWNLENASSPYFSITNAQIYQYFLKSHASSADLNLYNNVFCPIILVVVSNFVINEFFWIRNVRSVKEFIALIFVTFLVGFFLFNKSDLVGEGIGLWNSSFAILVIFYALNVFVRKNPQFGNQSYFFIFNFALMFLVFLNSSFSILVIVLCLLAIIFVIFKKIDFGLDLLIETAVFFAACICIFDLSKYSPEDAGSIILFSLLLGITIVLFCLFYIIKRNNLKTTYWFSIQRVTNQTFKYFKYLYLFAFIVFAVIVFIQTFSNISQYSDFATIVSRIDLLTFLKNVINYNAVQRTKEYTNQVFVAFYFILILISFIYLIFMWKKINKKKDNFVFFFPAVFFIFNPIMIFQIRYLTNFFTQSQQYDFSLFYETLIIFPFVIFSQSFKNMKISKIDFKLIKNKATILQDTNNNESTNYLIKKVKWLVNYGENIYIELIANDYFKLVFYSTLMILFSISIFVCNFI